MARTINQGRPQPLHGTFEDEILSYRIFRARAAVDDQCAPDRTSELLSFADRLAARGGAVVERDAAQVALMTGRDGLQSERFLERVRAANKGRLITFPAPDHDPDPEPLAARAA